MRVDVDPEGSIDVLWNTEWKGTGGSENDAETKADGNKREDTNRFHHVVEVILVVQHSSGPSDHPISIGNETCQKDKDQMRELQRRARGSERLDSTHQHSPPDFPP